MSEMKSVCLVTHNALEATGIGRLVLNAAYEFKNQGLAVGLVAARGSYEGAQANIDFRTYNPARILVNFIKLFMFARKYDTLLCFDIRPAGWYVALMSVLIRKPFFLHCVGTYSLFVKKSPFKNFFIKFTLSRTKKTFFLSHAVFQQIKKDASTILSTDKPIIIPPGVTTEIFYPVNTEPNKVKNPYVISVGAHKYRKGQDLAIRAFQQIASKYPELHYVFVGSKVDQPKFYSDLVSFAKENDLEDRVFFLSDVSDAELRELYSNAEFFVMTSRTTDELMEGFGIVYLEAALCGLTSIGAKGSGAADAIIDGETGLLVNADVTELSLAMDYLLNNKEVRLNFGRQAQKHANNFTWSNIVKQYFIHMKSD